MSFDSFIKYLQELLTMVKPYSPRSMMQAKAALAATVAFVWDSEKSDAITLRTMNEAMAQFDSLAVTRDEYAGVPGEYDLNRKKRQRLASLLRPTC